MNKWNITAISDIEPDVYLRPSFRISPFRSEDLVINLKKMMRNYFIGIVFLTSRELDIIQMLWPQGESALMLY
ncbi:hypothetical protein CP993_24270 [Escherichia coli]|nr:hypothetical protein CP993_24270 [Escherichia coli]